MVLCDGLLPLQSNILSHQGSKMLTDREKVRYTGRRGDRQVGQRNPDNWMETSVEDFGMIYLNIYLSNWSFLDVFLMSVFLPFLLLATTGLFYLQAHYLGVLCSYRKR